MISDYSTDRNLRAGKYILHADGYRTFLPELLPPKLDYDDKLQFLLSRAADSLGKLYGALKILPNPGLFVHVFVCKEAVLSGQIGDEQISLVNLLQKEAKIYASNPPDDIDDISNYVKMLNRGVPLRYPGGKSRTVVSIREYIPDGTNEPNQFCRLQPWCVILKNLSS